MRTSAWICGHDATVSEQESTWSCQTCPGLTQVGSKKPNGNIDRVEVGYDIIDYRTGLISPKFVDVFLTSHKLS